MRFRLASVLVRIGDRRTMEPQRGAYLWFGKRHYFVCLLSLLAQAHRVGYRGASAARARRLEPVQTHEVPRRRRETLSAPPAAPLPRANAVFAIDDDHVAGADRGLIGVRHRSF